MNKCIICGSMFECKNRYKRKTCSYECFCKLSKKNMNDGFKNTQFKKGNKPFNKGVSRKEWMEESSEENCSKTHIQYQTTAATTMCIEENRYLPHNTYKKGVVTKRTIIHHKGKNKGKTETNYYINIDWHGNRKTNNLYKKYLWEVANQQDLPKGYVVTTLDGNPDNLEIENLELITRAELLRRNRVKGGEYVVKNVQRKMG